MSITQTKHNLLPAELGIRLKGIFTRDTDGVGSALKAAMDEYVANMVAMDVILTAVVATLAEAKAVANAAALVALDTTLFDDGQLFTVEDTGALYRFNDGEAVGSEDPPESYDATDGLGVFHKTVALSKYLHDPVADVTAAKALAGVDLVDGMMVLIQDCDGAATPGLYQYISADVTAESLPTIIEVTAGGRLRDVVSESTLGIVAARMADVGGADEFLFTVGADRAVSKSGITKASVTALLNHYGVAVADTAALIALDVGGVLTAGTTRLVIDRGDGQAWRYRYVVGAVPTIDFGALDGIRVYAAGTNGYWTPEDLPAYIALANILSLQRQGNLGGGMAGTASTWKGSDEGDDPNGHGFIVDWDGGTPEEVVVVNAVKDACTTIALTVEALNLAIAQQTTGTNACGRLVYDSITGAYDMVFPEDVDASVLAITAPATANNIGITAKLAIATGVGTLFVRRARVGVEALLNMLKATEAGTSAEVYLHESGASPNKLTIKIPALGGDYDFTMPNRPFDLRKGTEIETVDLATRALEAYGALGGVGNDRLKLKALGLIPEEMEHQGSIAMAGLLQSGDFTAADTVDVGGDQYIADTDFAILPADVDGTLANLATAINGGTENVFAQAAGAGGIMFIYKADVPGGTPVVGDGTSVVLAVSITGPSTAAWSLTNLSSGGSGEKRQKCSGTLVVDAPFAAAMAASVSAPIAGLPFTGDARSTAIVFVTDTNGIPKYVDEAFVFDAGYTMLLATGQGGATPLFATDVIHWTVIE
jgi:hypothetical protein